MSADRPKVLAVVLEWLNLGPAPEDTTPSAIPIGIENSGRTLLFLVNGDGEIKINRITQARLRKRQLLADLYGEPWLLRQFPDYTYVHSADGNFLAPVAFDLDAAVSWTLDRCFEAAGYVPPSASAPVSLDPKS